MTTLSMSSSLYDDLWEHLRGDVEQAAFLLVDPPTEDGTIEARDLRLIAPDEFDIQTGFHISLGDSARAELILWAWETDRCVVEVHSHGEKGRARFSPSDLRGFRDWVPHLWWRLAGRPYGALVTAGDTFDGLVWRESPERPEQLDRIVLDDGRTLRATGLTLGDSRDTIKETLR